MKNTLPVRHVGERILAVVLILLLLAGCSAPELEDATGLTEDLEVKQEDVLEIQAENTPAVRQVEVNPTPALVQTDNTAPDSAPTPAQMNTPASSPTQSPTPTPGYQLTRVRDEKGYVLGHDVKLREGPGPSYDVVDVINFHTTLVITGKTEEWYRVEIGESLEGFMSKEFVGVGGIPTPTPTPKPVKSTPKPEIKQGEKGNYSDEDIYLVAKLIYAEGKNQTSESFHAMANVLYNRVNSKKFGGSVEKEVYRKNQFTVVDNAGFESLKPSSAALKAAKAVFNEGKRVIPNGVMYFRSAKKGKDWSEHTFYKAIGGNHYYY